MIMTVVGGLLGVILCLLLGVPYIDFLKKKTVGQYVKDVAPEAHAQKQGTPTTGGTFIVVSIISASIITLMLAQKLTTTALIILMTFFFYALAGFQDDFLKLKNKGNDGLSARGKFLRQLVIALLVALFVTLSSRFSTRIEFAYHYFELGWLYPIFAIFIITGASNAFNLTDGLDGLATSVGIPSFLACTVIALISGYSEVAIISATTVGALVGFLKYNKPKAQVFMGDTGSLALGGLLGTLAVVGKFEVWLLFLAIVFVCETLSVIIQVTSFRLTGKRVFKMSPIHHHFELCGWSEKRIVITFAIVSFIFSAIGVVLFDLFYRGLI